MKSLGPAQVDPLHIFSMAHAVFEKLPTGWLEQNTILINQPEKNTEYQNITRLGKL